MPSRSRVLLLGAAIVVAVGVGAAYAAFVRDVPANRERVAHGSQLIETRCGRIEYAAAGNGPAVLVVHGTGGGFDQGISAAGSLADHGLRVIAPSRFGYLRTPMPADASAQAQADAFVCLLDALGIERATVFGASAGALPALQFAIRHPKRCAALVLLVPAAWHPARASAPPPSPLGAWVLRTVVGSDLPFWLAARLAPDTAIRLVLATPADVLHAAPAAEQSRARRMLDEILPLSARTAGMLNDAREAGSPRPVDLKAIGVPALVFALRDDLFRTYEGAAYTAQQIAGARLVEFERGGHAWLGHHQEILAQTAQFALAAAR
jgi:pimeloyl-ACP methyl ester carboxylesterase